MMFAKYFEHYIITLRGGGVFVNTLYKIVKQSCFLPYDASSPVRHMYLCQLLLA